MRWMEENVPDTPASAIMGFGIMCVFGPIMPFIIGMRGNIPPASPANETMEKHALT